MCVIYNVYSRGAQILVASSCGQLNFCMVVIIIKVSAISCTQMSLDEIMFVDRYIDISVCFS